ncbi:MAG: homoserine kinase [Clostridiales bacterium]|jgi:homoserine kinase|nr:homoserine kinase [Clostridiales bacterium]
MIEIKVPATSANLGPGFDSIGMALELYNYVKIDKSDKLQIFSAIPEIPKDGSNLIYKTMMGFYDIIGKKPDTSFIIKQEDNIPLTRGLGSSAACTVAGVLAADYFSGAHLSKKELAYIAAEIEGHPDNSTPALVGGVVVGVMSPGALDYIKLEIKGQDKLKFAVMVPGFELPTEKARGILPKEYNIKDVVFNVSRAALLVAALSSGDFDCLGEAMSDRLHQVYRANIINNMDDIFKEASRLGAKASFLSGAGPTLISVVTDDEFFGKMALYLNTLEDVWNIRNIKIDQHGAVLMSC